MEEKDDDGDADSASSVLLFVRPPSNFRLSSMVARSRGWEVGRLGGPARLQLNPFIAQSEPELGSAEDFMTEERALPSHPIPSQRTAVSIGI